MEPILRVANASAFWGDRPDAAYRLMAADRAIDVLTMDYLAEVSMSILAKQRERDPAMGYAREFVDVVESLTHFWRQGRKFRVVANAGGLNPRACAAAIVEILSRGGCGGMKVGLVSGDDVLPVLRSAAGGDYKNLENGRPLAEVADRLVTANAYLGAAAIAEALAAGADIVVTGRVADPSLTVGPCMAHFGWSAHDYARVAGATIAGHLIECGMQVTGGISTDWLTIRDLEFIGYPIAEISSDGSCVITKPLGTGGRVDEFTVKEQLLYEIGDPAAYLSPDATVSFLGLQVADLGDDRVRVSGASGSAPPPKYKVSATYQAGWRAAGTLTIFGRDAMEKAFRAENALLIYLATSSGIPAECCIEYLGSGAVVMGALGPPPDAMEIVLRIAAADTRREIVEGFSRSLASLITAGPQGTTGYAEGRPPVRQRFGYWPTLIERNLVKPQVEIL